MGKKKPLKPVVKDDPPTVAEVFKTFGVSETGSKDPVLMEEVIVNGGPSQSASLQASNIGKEESPNVSQTLGDEDTSSDNSPESKNGANDAPRKEVRPQATWVSLFKGERIKQKGLELQTLENLPDIFDIEQKELDDTQSAWGSCLVGYFAGRFPGKIALLKLCNSWNVKFNYYAHSSGWLIFRFENEMDRDQVMAEGPYFVFGRPLMLKVMPSCFEFDDKDISLMPVWVNLPGLPLDCWNSAILSKICSKIGKPLSTDHLTATKARVSYARVMVEIDASCELVRSVRMRFPSGKIRCQPVIYEFEPKFCPNCKAVGHSQVGCKLSVNEMGRKKTNPVEVGPENQSKDVDSSVQHKEGKASGTPMKLLPSVQNNKAHKKILAAVSTSHNSEEHSGALPSKDQANVPSEKSKGVHKVGNNAAHVHGSSAIFKESQKKSTKGQGEGEPGTCEVQKRQVKVGNDAAHVHGSSAIFKDPQKKSTKGQGEGEPGTCEVQKRQVEDPNQLVEPKKKKAQKQHDSNLESLEIVTGSGNIRQKDGKGRKDKGVLAKKSISTPKKDIRRSSSLHISQ